MNRCHVCGSNQELSRCSNCGHITCADCLKPQFVCTPCMRPVERCDLGNVADAMTHALKRFKACLAVETNPIAVLECAPDVADAHALILELEALLPARVDTLRGTMEPAL